jgi:hypothetical protein
MIIVHPLEGGGFSYQGDFSPICIMEYLFPYKVVVFYMMILL